MDSATPVADLVRAATAGRQDAWDALVERYAPLVRTVVRRHRLLGSDAEDVVQTVWLRLVEHLGELRVAEALPGWIVATTRNECIRVIRSRRRTVLVDTTDEATDREQPLSTPFVESVVERMERDERHELLLTAFAELPGRQHALLSALAEDPAPSYAEISRRLDIPIGSIGPTRARALERIRRHPAVAAWMAADDVDDGDGDRRLVRGR
jgi:RNA polymerase sigma factor (sigma-70 family)